MILELTIFLTYVLIFWVVLVWWVFFGIIIVEKMPDTSEYFSGCGWFLFFVAAIWPAVLFAIFFDLSYDLVTQKTSIRKPYTGIE